MTSALGWGEGSRGSEGHSGQMNKKQQSFWTPYMIGSKVRIGEETKLTLS